MASKTRRPAKQKTQRPARRRAADTDKQLALEAIDRLPDNASFEQIAEELAILRAIEEGLKQADAGHLIPHEEVKRQVMECLSK
jgi:predicted transcriptional regulator